MDYLQLKKTLMAAFDHFLSCHDKSELEEMMQAFEAGKSLVIKFPEPIHREDYRDDVLVREDRKDDVRRMDIAASAPQKSISRIRRKKPKAALKTNIKEVKICAVPILLDLAQLSKEKRHTLQEVLKGAHKITLSDIMVSDMHGFAKARIFKLVQGENHVSSCERLHSVPHDSPFSSEAIPNRQNNHMTTSSLENRNISLQKEIKSDDDYREKLIDKIILEIKKYHDPP